MYTYKAKLLRVVYGDTIDAEIDLGFKIYIKERIRLAGIDTPETRTRNLMEKTWGQEAKKRVVELLDETDDEFDGYHRWVKRNGQWIRRDREPPK